MKRMPGDDLPPASLGVGLLVGSKYRLLEQRGAGAMGSVWKAVHTDLGYIVGIKFLHKAIANRRESLGRFDREAKIAARLGEASQHMTKVHDHGTLPGGMPYVVMELLEGEGLDARIKSVGRLPFDEIVEILLQLSKALQIAHDQNVVHRDLKPANVFLTKAEDDTMLVKLLDFGVAKATLDNASYATTNTGALIGTPSYMSPEQLSHGGAVDWRSDLWALALIVYRMAVGAHPFGRGTLEELAMKIVTSPPIVPSEVVGGLPRGFDAWVTKGLQKKPGQRFQSARELAASLAALRSGEAMPLTIKPTETLAPATVPASVDHTIVDTLVIAPPTQMVYSRPRKADAGTNPTFDRTLIEAGSTRSPQSGGPAVLALVVVAGLLVGIGTVVVVTRARPAASVAAPPPPRELAAPRAKVAEQAVLAPAPMTSAAPEVRTAPSATPSASPSAAAPKPRPTRHGSDVDTQAKKSWEKGNEM